jgi:DNA polymerase-3 subunit delta'
MGFDKFIGNPKILERLRTKLREGRFPHGLIFAGPEGIGKHTCALMIAKALNCTSAGPADFCDSCSSCRKINANTHPDVMVIGVEEEATQIRIAQIRQALATLEFQPLEGSNKVFIIDPANLMNAESANALLKGLEEPPDNSFFVLIAVNIQELLLTVRSRCQIYHFPPLTTEEVRSHGVEDELIIRWSQGSIGKAQSLSPERLKARREDLVTFLETAAGAKDEDFRDLLAASADIARSKQDFGNDMTVLSVLMRDLLFISEGVSDKVINFDIEARLKKLSLILTSERLIQMAGFLRVIETSLKSNVNRQMLLDVFSVIARES